LRTKAEFLVKNDFAAQILLVEFFARSATPPRREIPGLCSGECSSAHGVFVRDRRDLRFGLRPSRCASMNFKKRKQALPLKLVELLRQVQKTLRRSPPLRAARTRFAASRRNAFPPARFSRHCDSDDCRASFASAKTVREIWKFSAAFPLSDFDLDFGS
jgi:hypothetical protein